MKKHIKSDTNEIPNGVCIHWKLVDVYSCKMVKLPSHFRSEGKTKTLKEVNSGTYSIPQN